MRVPYAHLCAILMAGQRGGEVLQFPLSRCGDGAMKMHSRAWDGAEQSSCSMINNPAIADSPSVAKACREQGIGKASIWLIWVCPLYPEIGPTALVSPSPWGKTFPSSNQRLNFKMQWAVADLEL